MKYFLFFLFVTSSFYPQTGKITYSSVFNFGGNQVSKNKNELVFTHDASFYQSKIDRKTEKDEKTKTVSDDNKIVEININVGTDSIGNTYYHNLKENKIICREAIFKNPGLKYYTYIDRTNINWQLLNEFKEISGYKCQKATATFRGRKYEAYFTSEIPLSYGPWKFGGLPGLILEIYDQTGEVYFSAEEIEIPFNDAIKNVRKPEGDPIDYREFVEMSNESSTRISQAILARMPKGSTLVSTKTKRNGIELKHPWEKE